MEDIAELGQKMFTNITKDLMEEILLKSTFRGMPIHIGDGYLPILQDYGRNFGIKI